jgi:hypothetical protein
MQATRMLDRRRRVSTARPAALCALLFVLACALCAPAVHADDGAAALRARFDALAAQARAQAPTSAALSPFGVPVYLLSTETSDRIDGEVYARIDHPFDELRRALDARERWCEILILHLNVKYCRAAQPGAGDGLFVGIGRKTWQDLADAYFVRFEFRDAGSTPEHLRVELRAPTGPMSTRDYRIAVEAAALDRGASVLRLSYGYSFGLMGKLAMQSYLATLGRDKVGFSVVGRGADGLPAYVGGVRGVVERNAMRYFLAIGAHLAVEEKDGRRPLHACLRAWFDATERYPKQLHELERAEYLEMKARELLRQQTVVYPPAAG